jgi:hypothetical protein
MTAPEETAEAVAELRADLTRRIAAIKQAAG